MTPAVGKLLTILGATGSIGVNNIKLSFLLGMSFKEVKSKAKV